MNPIIIIFIIFVFVGEISKKQNESKQQKRNQTQDRNPNMGRTTNSSMNDLKDIFKQTYEGFENRLDFGDDMKSIKELLEERQMRKAPVIVEKKPAVEQHACGQNEDRIRQERQAKIEEKVTNLNDRRKEKEKVNKKIDEKPKVKNNLGLNNRDELARAIIISEILGEPKSISNRKKNM